MNNENKNYKILFLNGPNLNLIGIREPQHYGNISYEKLIELIKVECEKFKITPIIFQSNSEGELIDKIHENRFVDLIIGNLGAYTHTSIAIRDAFLAIDKPLIEVHLSNIYKREKFRQKSLISDISIGVISGFGYYSYILAIHAANNYLKV